MPRYISVLVFSSILLVSQTYADDEVSPIEFCKELSIIAKEVMTARQMDQPMSETLPFAQTLFRSLAIKLGREVDEEIDEAIVGLVMGAYEKPSYDMPALQQSEINDFENLVFAECYKGIKSVPKD